MILTGFQVPKMWSAKAYNSLKSLGSWVRDLTFRLDFISVSTLKVSFLTTSKAFRFVDLGSFRSPDVLLVVRVLFSARLSDWNSSNSRPEI